MKELWSDENHVRLSRIMSIAQKWDSTVFSRYLNKPRQTFKHRGWRSCDLHGFFYVSRWSFCIVQCGRCCSHYILKGWYESGLLRIHCMSAWQTSSWSTLDFRSRVGQVLMVTMVKWLSCRSTSPLKTPKQFHHPVELGHYETVFWCFLTVDHLCPPFI